ncbi:PRC-barrel domain-containing protein [Kitasatospora camelliae]|uniref:PRC-barrel domain-containing protein n=1 Tax=Kitasatospora camelliae TaxID=3156397 RepID=A0AAU8JS60_9ACTN
MTRIEIWEFRTTSGFASGADLVGFRVEAVDGHIGKVDRLSAEVGSAYLVVDTGPWIFGRHVLLPAGTVDRVDTEERKVFVDRTKDEIKAGPEFDPDTHDAADRDYRGRYDTYYTPFYGGIGHRA